MTKTEEMIEKAKSEVSELIFNSTKLDDKLVIKRYTAAIKTNFTDIIGKTRLWTRHEDAKWALDNNLSCETIENHAKMLGLFAKNCNASPNSEDFDHIENEIYTIQDLLGKRTSGALSGLTVLAILENTSEIFIPDLARRARQCGCEDLSYIHSHGLADHEHSQEFIKALESERTMGYNHPQEIIYKAHDPTINLLKQIYSQNI